MQSEILGMAQAIRAELTDDVDFATQRRIIELLDVRATARIVDGQRVLDVTSVIERIVYE